MKGPKQLSKKKKWLITSAFVFFIAAGLLWLKFSDDTKIKRAALKALPLPIALIESHPVTSREFMRRLSDYREIYGKTPEFNEAPAKTKILERLELEAKYEVLARRKNASLVFWKNFESPAAEEAEQSESLLRAQKSKAREDALKFWFFSQKNLNSSAYETAEHLKNEINKSADFGELAKSFSQDPASRSLEGDSGPIKQSSLLYELKEPLLSAKQGELLILPSRLGVHLIQLYLKKISESGEDVLYLKQIFLNGTDFEVWVKNETKDYKIIKLIDIN